jgi:flavin reductase (DIM6/NTAB) family NADH-FMN oxidoreductase RutF
MNDKSPSFDLTGSEALRAVFRNHASGITVVTSATDSGEPIGFTASSVTSLGSNPPLVSLNIAQGSSSYEHLCPGKLVAIHTLDSSTLWLAERMAGDKQHRYATPDFSSGPENTPIFTQVPAVLLARVKSRTEVAANAVIVLDALSSESFRQATQPLVYFQRGYHTLGERLKDNT